MFEDGNPKGTAKTVPTIQRRRKQCASDTNFWFTVFCYCDRVCPSCTDARNKTIPKPQLRASQDGVAGANFPAT